ncbi:MAG: calcium-binding protein [Cyanobacteria bacterium J06573_2]
MAEEKITIQPINPIDKPIPVEPDFPIGGRTPEAIIKVEGNLQKAEARTSGDSLLIALNVIEGSDNPEILFSTPDDDLVLAKGGDDTIYGSLGNDTYNGGDGFDTLDYSLLGKQITLLPRGFIGNGNSQGSQIQEIERIVAAPDKDNLIDGSGGGDKGVFFTIDLGKEKLVIENIPGRGSVEFEVENFVNIEGTENDDSLTGNDKRNRISGNGGNDELFGGLESDTLIGGLGNDTLIGVDPSLSDTIRSERDTLTGGFGVDKFILGNDNGSFYDDFKGNDFARISDFSFGETIQLSSQGTYRVKQDSDGFNVFIVEDSIEDIIAKVTVSRGISSSSSASAKADSGLTIAAESNVNSLLGDVPEGEFTLNSGEQKGIFVA